MIRQATAYEFWQKYFGAVLDGSADTLITNPAITFTRNAKAGEYDSLSDEEYETILAECEQFSSLWNDLPSRRAGSILLELIQRTTVSDGMLHRLLQLLAVCSAHSQYAPPKAGGESAEALSGAPGRPTPALSFLPQAIYARLSQDIRGQDAAKRTAAMVLYNHLNGRRSNALFCGPTGCGKSEIWRRLARDYPGLIRIFDASRLSAEGWKGSLHLRDMFLDLPDCFEDQGLIVVLDEADKLCCEQAMSANGTNHSALTQNSLLKLLDGDTVQFGAEDGKPAFSVDCSRVSVVLLGAFENLMLDKSEKADCSLGFGASLRQKKDYANTTITYDDLISAGMRREIAGRINRIVSLRPLSVSDYRAILLGPVLRDLQSKGRYTIVLDDATLDRLAEQAASTGLGVRWARSQIMNAVDELMFDDPSSDTYNISIPPERLAG